MMSDTLELPTHEENPVEDVEIELTEEELDGETPPEPDPEPEPQAADPEPDPEPEPKKKPRADNRVASALAKAEEAERRAAEATARAEEAERIRQQSDRAMMFHYEQRLETQVAGLKKQLTEAKAVGDSEAEIEAMTKLTDVQAELRGVKSWLGAEPAAEPERKPEPKPEPKAEPKAAEPQVTYDARTVAWIEQNEWFQPQSDNFDQEMFEEATLFAKRLERRLKAAGKAKDIGNDDYFAEIDRHIREEFPDAFDDAPPQKRTPPMKRDATAVPVTRSANGGVTPNKNVVRLTADERRIAHSLAANGAITNKDGSRPTPEQAEKIYAIQRMKQSRG